MKKLIGFCFAYALLATLSGCAMKDDCGGDGCPDPDCARNSDCDSPNVCLDGFCIALKVYCLERGGCGNIIVDGDTCKCDCNCPEVPPFPDCPACNPPGCPEAPACNCPEVPPYPECPDLSCPAPVECPSLICPPLPACNCPAAPACPACNCPNIPPYPECQDLTCPPAPSCNCPNIPPYPECPNLTCPPAPACNCPNIPPYPECPNLTCPPAPSCNPQLSCPQCPDLIYGECSANPCECDGKVSSLTLRNDGSAGTIVVTQKDGQVVFNGPVQAGEEFSFTGVDKHGTLGIEIAIKKDGCFNVMIHTSCSQPIAIGMTFGDFTITDGSSRNNGKLCTVDQSGLGGTP